MNPYSIPNFVVSIITIALGIFVFVSNPKLRKNQLFSILALTTFIWLFSYGILYSTEDYAKAVFIAKIGHLGAVFITPCVYFFLLEIIKPYKPKHESIIAQLSLFMAFSIFFLINLPSIYFKKIVLHSWGYYPLAGPLMIFYAIFTFAVALRGFYIVRKSAAQAREDLDIENYQRYKYYTLSIIIFMPASIDYLAKFGLNIYPCGYIFVALFISLVTYAILRHSLLNINIMVKKSLVYSILVSIITFIYLFLVLIGEHIFRSFFNYNSIFTALGSSCIIALLFNPIRIQIQKILDIFFLKVEPQKIIDEYFQMKSELKKADQMKAVATLASGMAHEIKNPLTAIKTFTEHLSEKSNNAEFISKFKRVVGSEVDKIDSLVKQLLDFSKPSPLKIDSVNINQALDETLDLLNSELIKNKIKIKKNYQDHITVDGDIKQLRQVFLNIYLNSIQAMTTGGLILTSVFSENNSFVILIEDTGCGIPKECLSQVYDPFFTTKETGTGLGLSIVQGILNEHKIRINISSQVNCGTKIELKFNSLIKKI